MKTNLQRDLFFLFRDKYGEKWSEKMLGDIARLKAGKPPAYVIGWVPFLNTKIDLSQEPLIPRPETEYWTEKFINRAKEIKWPPARIADVFAGSGCIGVAILKNLPQAKVDFFELDPKLILQIKKNLKLNKIPPSRYKVIQSDILKKAKGKYDFIVGNPPYLNPQNIKRIQKSVLKYEPKKALFGGKEGLAIISRFIKETKKYLKKDGGLVFEFDSPQKTKINSLLKKEGYKNIEFRKDQYGKWRTVMASRFPFS
jgi:release factor glutamine methyltransferase